MFVLLLLFLLRFLLLLVCSFMQCLWQVASFNSTCYCCWL